MKEKSKQLQTFILSLMMLIMGAAGAWADNTTFSLAKADWGNSAINSKVQSTITLAVAKGGGSSDPGSRTNAVRLKNGNTLTVSSSNTITAVQISYVTNDGKSVPSANTAITASIGSWSDNCVNWSGNATSVTFTSTGEYDFGSVTVTYTTGGGKSAGDFTFTTDEGSVYVGRTLDIKTGNYTTSDDGAITFSSSDNTIATVNVSTGVVTGVAAGKATITATQAEGTNRLSSSDTYTITVNAAPTQYTITLAANDNDMGYVTAIYYVADDYNDKAENEEFTSGTKVSSGTRLTITAHPNTGYEFNETANPYDDGGVTKYRPWGNATGSTTATFITATLDNGDKTYTAHFKAKTYTITLDKGTGGATDGEATATYNSSALTSVTDATHATLTLKGYYTDTSGGTKVINANGTLVTGVDGYTDGSGNWKHDGDVKLYAQWEAAATYTVTYDANLTGTTGSVPDAEAYAEGASVTVADKGTLAKSGYTFLGWSTASGYQSSYYTAGQTFTMGTANVTLYAQWKLNSSLESSTPSSGTVVTGGSISTTASSPATGMYLGQAGSAYNAATLMGTTPRGTSFTSTLNSSDAGGTQVLSILLTDGTFYSDVITHSYTVGVATPVISCSSNTVTITCATTGATIYYTTDGTTPSESNGTEYSTSFPIGTTTTVKAIAIKNETSSEVASQNCAYTSFSWPVSINFDGSDAVWSTSDDLTGAAAAQTTVHGVTFRGTSSTEFKIINDGSQHLQVNSNASTNHYFAIPLEEINGRIDIYVTAPYTTSNYKVRSYLDTANGTTVQLNSPKSPSAVAWSDYDISSSPGVFHYRIEDISVTTGVLYLGVNSSSYKLIDKVRITTPGATLVASPASVTMGDAEKDTCTVTITNYSTHRAALGNVPSYVNASFNPSTGELVITPKAIGTGGNITLAVDTNDDGVADDTDLSIPVTVHGITINTQPASAIYEYGTTATALSASASKSAGMGGTITYQWYKNTVNSNTGGTAISGATSSTYTPSTTNAAEDAAFYYYVAKVAKDTIKAQTSNVAYVLTTSSGRKFHMSNIAGNRQTTETSETITGQVIAGGSATAYYGNGEYYRYITRPTTDYAHMYVVNQGTNYISIKLDNAVATGDQISVRLNGYLGASAGITISDGTNSLDMYQTDTDNKVYTATVPSGFNGKTAFTIKGRYDGMSNYFTDLVIYTPGAVKITDPTPGTQTIQSGETPTALTVTASDGTGTYSFLWQISTDNSSWTGVTTPTDGTVTTDGATSTFAPVALTATRYYRCIVTDTGTGTSNTDTSGAATVTVTPLTHGWYIPSFTGNENIYVLNQSNYDTQNSDPVTTTSHFWTKDSSVGYENKTISEISASSDNYYNIRNDNNYRYIEFYVKGATSFQVVAGDGNNTSRTLDVKVDGTKVGTVTHNGKWSTNFSLNGEGSLIRIDNASSKVYLGGFKFYKKSPATIIVKKDGEAITEAEQYIDAEVDYEVESNSTGDITVDTSAEGYDASVATASYAGGVLTVTSLAAGTTTITLKQDANATHAEGSTTLTVTVKKHTVILSFSFDKSSYKGTSLTEGDAISASSLPVLTAKYDDGRDYTGTIYYHSDDRNIGYFGVAKGTYASSDYGVASTEYTIRYGGGQGGARIYAYVNSFGNYDQAVAYFDLVVENGTSNKLPKGTSPEIYQQFPMRNSAGEEVVRITYGGYKYIGTKTGKWSTGDTRGKYFVDGYEYYTRYGSDDAKDEYNHQLKGMSDDYFAVDSLMWYQTSETKPDGTNYVEFERVRPFNLPCRGSYIKFEPKKSGKLTAYVWQNGTIDESKNTLGSKPRLGYWFDQDGWVQHPTTAPVTKQPLGVMSNQERKGRDGRNVDSQMTEKWTAAQGDQNMAKLLKYKYCKVALPDSTTAVSQFHENNTDSGWEGAYENPYYWGTNDEVGANLDLAVPKSMTPVPFHNGYLIPEAAYVKYTLNVVAGKTYYFYGMMTKIGYAGMNFVEDDAVLGSDIEHKTATLHLQTNDDMTTYTFNGSVLSKSTVFDEVTLPSNYRKAKWNTICLPFALSEDQVEEAFGKGTQLAIFNGLNHDSANHIYHIRYLRHVDQNILPGQPYLIYPTGVDAGGEDLPNVDGVIGDNTIEGASGTRITFSTVFIDIDKLKQANASYGNDKDADGTKSYIFTGSYKPTAIEKYDIYNTPKTGELKRYMGAGTSLNTYHALIKANDSNIKQDAISFSFTEDDVEKIWESVGEEATRIELIADDGIAEYKLRAADNGKAYNLMGQEIDPRSAKGLVIINGKKVMY